MGKQGDNMLGLQEERREERRGREGGKEGGTKGERKVGRKAVTLCSSCIKSSAGKPTQARNTFIMH